MNLAEITPVLLTFNEKINIGRTLDALQWAEDIVVVDSGSSDGTLELLRRNPRVRVFHCAFDSHAQQWSFRLRETSISTPWVLALDADHIVSEGLVAELRRLTPPDEVSGYRASFTYVMDGKRKRPVITGLTQAYASDPKTFPASA